MTLVDTSFVIDLLRGNEAVTDRLGELIVSGGPIKMSSITLAELERGLVFTSASDETQVRMRNNLESIETIPVIDAIAIRAGGIRGKLDLLGRTLPTEDCIIAATAMWQGSSLLTADRGFERIHDLDVEFYR